MILVVVDAGCAGRVVGCVGDTPSFSLSDEESSLSVSGGLRGFSASGDCFFDPKSRMIFSPSFRFMPSPFMSASISSSSATTSSIPSRLALLICA